MIRPVYGNALLDRLSDEDHDLLAPHVSAKVFERDAVLHEPADIAASVYFPAGAILSVITLMEDGRGVESSTIGRESAHGVLSAFGSYRAHNRVIVQVGGPCYVLPTPRLRQAAQQSSNLADLLIRFVQCNTAQVEQSVACNALHPVEARLARWILMCADRGDGRRVPLTQEYLAIMLGVQRTTVTQAARTLQASGMIDYARGEIEVVDREALKGAVCECYDVVRQKFELLLGGRAPSPREAAVDQGRGRRRQPDA